LKSIQASYIFEDGDASVSLCSVIQEWPYRSSWY